MKLTKAGDRFFDFQTGEAYNPTQRTASSEQLAAFELLAPDATRYVLSATSSVMEEIRPDGKKFILSDSGITAVSTGETIQFVWSSSSDAASPSPLASHLSSITSPDGRRIVYTYDRPGNLVSVRDLITGDTSRYGYDAQHRVTLLTRTGQPGSVVEYSSPGTSNLEPSRSKPTWERRSPISRRHTRARSPPARPINSSSACGRRRSMRPTAATSILV